MKQKATRAVSAFTRTELSVVILVLVVLVAILLVSSLRGIWKQESRWGCAWNLGRIGVACRVWAQDHNGHFPAAESSANGGWKELLANADQGANCWTNFAIMAGELPTPKVLLCPVDKRSSATDFITNGLPLDRALVYFKDNSALSYFIGVGANSRSPDSLLAGDRNLGGGIEPDRDYGFSPKSGKGNDVAMQNNSMRGPVSWSLKMHSFGNAQGAGTVLFSDGSYQKSASSRDFRRNVQPFAGRTTDWPAGHVPASPSVRLVFP